MNRPLIIVSGLRPNEVDIVRPYLERMERPMYLEGTSRLKGSFPEFEVHERAIGRLAFDGVIRIGSVPTLRYWRDLETTEMPVYHYSSVSLSGLPRERRVFPLSELKTQSFETWTSNERRRNRELLEKIDALIEKYPLSEPAWVNWLSREIPSHARLFLGNSLPIREWDFAAVASAPRDIFANRGTNGIDGLISTFAGVAREDAPNWAILGDLSVMYDLSGPWALRQRPIADFNIAVINNGGGQIFHRIFNDPLFINAHDVRFEGWAKMWSLEYARMETPGKLGRGIVEIVPSPEQTSAFWSAL